jgi:predicted RNA-binding protein with RPS1 domain
MVASVHADDSVIVADSEEQGMRGETRSMDDKKELTAEVEEEAVAVEEQQVEAEPETEAVEEAVVAEDATAEAGADDAGAEGEGSGMDEEDEESDDDQGDDSGEEGGPEADDREEKRVSEQANAEMLSHSVDTHESVENWGGDPVHVVEVTERYVETIEQQERTIAELKTRIAELEEIEGKYNTIIAEREAAEMAEKQAQAKAFAEKQGLDVTVAEVQEAIENLDYTAIAEMTMAQEQNEEEKADEPAAPAITLASFVDLEVSDDNAYGGLLKPRSK